MKTRLLCLILALMLLAVGCRKKPAAIKTTLHEAAEAGDLERIESLISSGADVNAKDQTGDTPLHLAAGYGHKDVVELLLIHNADINAKDDLGETPLHVAASHGRIDVAGLFIASGADVNAKDSGGTTPLYYAIQLGFVDMDMAEFLIANGADVNVHSEAEAGCTPLHEAASIWCKPLVQLLIDSGANLNRTNDERETPADHAMSFDNREIAKLLVGAGADATIHLAAYIGDLGKVRSFLESGTDVNTKDENDRTPLHIASREGHSDIVQLLISEGANVNAKGMYDVTPLLEATQKGHKDIVELLLAHGAEVNAMDYFGSTPLFVAVEQGYKDLEELLIKNGAEVTMHIAAYIGDLEKVRSLLEGGADVNAIWPFSGTPLHMAARQGHIEVAELLIANGADINVKYCDITPLHEAVGSGHKDMAELLITKSADVNANGFPNSTLLHLAAGHGYKDVVEMLIAKGADVNAKGLGNSTPLHAAAILGYKDVIELLLKNGAEVNVKNDAGQMPLSWPAYYGNTDIVKLLVANGADVNARNPERREPVLDTAIALGFADIVELLGGNVKELSNSNKGPYSMVVTDPKAVKKFLEFAGIDFDQVWIPKNSDLEGLESILRAYLEKNASTKEDTCLDNILRKFRWYNREYSGFINAGTRYIVCNMHSFDEWFPSKPLDNKFRRLFDIGCNVTMVIFDPQRKVVIRIACNNE